MQGDPFSVNPLGGPALPAPMKPNMRLPPFAPIVPFQCAGVLLAVMELPF